MLIFDYAEDLMGILFDNAHKPAEAGLCVAYFWLVLILIIFSFLITQSTPVRPAAARRWMVLV